MNVEDLIPVLDHLVTLGRCRFADDVVDPIQLIQSTKMQIAKAAELKKKKEVLEEQGKALSLEEETILASTPKFVPAIWQMIPITRLLQRIESSRSSSSSSPLPPTLIRWLTDTYSFVRGNASVICLTDAGSTSDDAISSTLPPLIQMPIGVMGVLRPDVMEDFHVHSIAVAAEINLEPLILRML